MLACSCTHACLRASIAQAGKQAARPPHQIHDQRNPEKNIYLFFAFSLALFLRWVYGYYIVKFKVDLYIE